MPAHPALSVVIPAFNERERIQPTLDAIIGYLRERSESFEILVADDGSRDGTAETVEGRNEPEVRVLRSERNKGKGAAVRRGVLASRGERVLFTDADLAVPIDQLERFDHALGEDSVAIVCASKALPDSEALTPQPWFRRAMGRSFNLAVRALDLSELRDTQCGFKLFRGQVARELFARSRVATFAFDVEILWLAKSAGYRAVELPVRWRHDPASRVRALGGSLKSLFELFRIRFFSPH